MGCYSRALALRSAVLIFNPNAGAIIRRRPRFDAALAELRRQGISLTVAPTRSPGHAAELAGNAVAGGAEAIIAAGGDGTVNEVLNGMAGSRVPLAVLPCGTANVLACETGMRRDALAAARQFPELGRSRIAVGRLKAAGAAPRYFLLMAGVGLDAEVLRHVDLDLKRRWGKLAYWMAGFSLAGRALNQARVATSDGLVLTTSFALAARVRNYGGDLAIAAGADLLRDDFELVAFRAKTTWPYLAYLGGAAIGQAARIPGVEAMRATSLRCDPTNGPVFVQVDGEPAGELPARIETVPDAITLMLPRAATSRRS